MKKSFLILYLCLYSSLIRAESVSVTLSVPEINESPYHRPYVAVWVETPQREGVTTIAVWHEKDKWLKDLRLWWRKLGRDNIVNFDTVTGATRKPGLYQLTWDGLDQSGAPLSSGEYYLCFEAAREDGGREFIRQKVQLGADQVQHFKLDGNAEFGSIDITIK